MTQTEVAVVGAGLIGALCARELQRRGRRVVLVERSRPAAEASGAAAGIIGTFSETDTPALTTLAAHSAGLYPELIAELRAAGDYALDYARAATIFVAASEEEAGRLRERERRCLEVGGKCDELSPRAARTLEPILDRFTGAAALFHGEGRVDSAALTSACVDDFQRRGGRLIAGEGAARIHLDGDRVGGVEVAGETIACDAVVDARGAWALAEVTGRDWVRPVRGQIVCLRARRRVFAHTVYRESVYFAARRDGRLLIGSTREEAGFDKAVTAGAVAGILRRAFELCGHLRDFEVADYWSGLRPVSRDGMPLIGWLPGVSGYLLAGGHGRNGVLLAPITALIVADLVDGTTRPEYQAVCPARASLR